MGFPINFIDISAIIVGITALLIYFGKVIGDTKVEKHEKTDWIIQGVFFVLIFILFPAALCLFLYQKEWIISIPLWGLIIFHFFVVGFYSKHNDYIQLIKFDMQDWFKKEFNKKIKKFRKKDSVVGKQIRQKKDFAQFSLNLQNLIYKPFGNFKVLFLLSILLFYSLGIAVSTNNLLAIVVISILAFINFSLVARAYGQSSAKYPWSKIILLDGKKIEGKTLKFGDFVYLINKNKKYFVNKDQIKYIEQQLMEDSKNVKKKK